MSWPWRGADRRWLRVSGSTFVVLAVAALTFPATPRPIGLLLDSNWRLGLNMIHGQGMSFGGDMIFPYGPLSFLSFPDFTCGLLYTPLLYRLALWATWVLLAFRLALGIEPSSIGTAQAAFLGVVGLVDFVMPTERLELAIVAASALALVERGFGTMLLLGGLAGAAALTKVNLGVLCAGLLPLVALGADGTWRRRACRLGVGAAAAVASVLLLDAGICGGRVALLAYAASVPEVLAAFEATSLDGPRWVPLLAAASLAGLALIVGFAHQRRRLLRAVPAAAWMWFLFYKHAIVRQDAGHAAPMVARLALPAVLLVVLAASRRDRRRLLVYEAAAIVVGVVTACVLHPTWWSEVRPAATGARTVAAVRDALSWRQTWARLQQEGVEAMSMHRLSQRYHARIDGRTVDAQPWQTVQVLANGWTWAPPPMFPAYLVASAAVDARNAAHIVGPGAAGVVLLRWEGEVDGNHPFLRSPLTWQAYVCAYRVATFRHVLVVLERRPRVRPPDPEPRDAAVTRVRWDEPVGVPTSADLLVARATVRKTLYGRLRAFLFRPCPVFLDVRYRDGATARWRTSGTALQAGFIGNHLPRTIDDANAFFEGGPWSADEVVELRFHTEGPAQYQSPIDITWFDLPRPRS